jgi:hypothetical protein
MKFTIFNYSSPAFLQPIYIKSEIEKISGCSADLINDLNHVYYVYDRIKPDLSIVNAGMGIEQLLHYNKNSKTKIKHILNIDYIKDEYIEDIQNFIKNEKDFNCVLIISSNISHKNIKFDAPYVHIGNCVDLNIGKSKKVFDIEKAVIAHSKKDMKEYDSTYHMIYINNTNQETVGDFKANNITAGKIFANYNQVIVRNVNPDIIPEVFFNAMYYGNKVYFDNDEKSEEVNGVVNKLFGTDISYDYKDCQNYDINTIKKHIEEKHTPKNRLKQMLSNIKGTNEIISRI